MAGIYLQIKIFSGCLGAAITLPDMLHGFQSGRVTGTVSFEVKLLHQLTSMRQEFMCTLFIGLYDHYNALDRDRFLDTLEGYGVLPR